MAIEDPIQHSDDSPERSLHEELDDVIQSVVAFKTHFHIAF
jgi:hypothetical protein